MEAHDSKISLKIFYLLLASLCLFGLTMVYSSSYIYSKEILGSPGILFFKQLLYFICGIGLVFFLSKTKFSFWINRSSYFQSFSFLLILLSLLPGLGREFNGASRWIGLGGITFQPSELLKISCIFYGLYFFENFFNWSPKQKLKKSFLLFVPMILLLLQPDFGSFALCTMNLFLICFFSKFSRKYFYTSLGFSVSLGMALIASAPYRLDRITSFLNPWQDPQKTGYQLIQSFYSFASGGWFGEGIGNSKEKLFYLPEAYNDFIFSVIGEELGFIGLGLIILLFLTFLAMGVHLALKAPERLKTIVMATIILSIGFQGIVNLGVVLGLLPTKGLNFPFVSYGGSSLIANFIGIGLFLSCLKQESEQPAEPRMENITYNYSPSRLPK